MKFYAVVALLVSIIGFSSAFVLGNGRPGCRTDEEIRVKYYRNIWDPTVYWVCTTKDTPASSGKCPDMEAWDDTLKVCVDFDDWSWTDPVEPLSSA